MNDLKKILLAADLLMLLNKFYKRDIVRSLAAENGLTGKLDFEMKQV